jgi:hypothetical protein
VTVGVEEPEELESETATVVVDPVIENDPLKVE